MCIYVCYCLYLWTCFEIYVCSIILYCLLNIVVVVTLQLDLFDLSVLIYLFVVVRCQIFPNKNRTTPLIDCCVFMDHISHPYVWRYIYIDNNLFCNSANYKMCQPSITSFITIVVCTIIDINLGLWPAMITELPINL